MNEITIITGFKDKDISTLKSFIGKKLIKMRHETFTVSNTVMCVVEFDFEDSTYSLIASIDAIRYYNAPVEDISCFHVIEGPNPYDVIKLIDDAVESRVEKITVVTDIVHASSKDGTATYVNTITTGVIFTFTDGHELGFERYDDFIEGIDIHKGYNVLTQFEKPEYWLDGMEEDFDATVERFVDMIE